MKERADEMINCHPLGESLLWSMEEKDVLDRLIHRHDITVSLLPYTFHTDVALLCLKHRKPLVTTSYVQPAMKELDREAIEKGVLLLNEIGLDPGIDHMSAMAIIDRVHSEGGTIDEFWSICGALPAPEAANNPMKYKFSWSPRGVVMASRNGATYLKEGKTVTVEPKDLFKDRFSTDFPGLGQLEVYPNRDSASYTEIYGIEETRTMYRGTFRYKGWCETLDLFKEMGMLDDSVRDYSGYSPAGFIAERAGIEGPATVDLIAELYGPDNYRVAVEALDWLGFFSDDEADYGITSPFEITASKMIEKMELGNNERDMVVLQHIFRVINADGTKKKIVSSMLDFGSPATNTSIARTVALPAAIAVKLILEGKINLSGVLRPVMKEVYDPVLKGLEELGIVMTESVSKE
jgi:saccharopine dehydrogenase-like NADP-dependent oxidoreductase